jgi:DNA-binding PadR family transcriptional regulator
LAEYSLPLTEEGREILTEILDQWLEPFEEATKDVEQDKCIETPEDLLAAINGMHYQFDLVTTIREELQRMRHGTAGSIQPL